MFRSSKCSAVGLFALLALSASAQIGGTGWTPAPVTFNVQWPYTTNQSSRYWFTNGIYNCLVYSNDSPFKAGSTTLPRTEQRFTLDYTSGGKPAIERVSAILTVAVAVRFLMCLPIAINCLFIFEIHRPGTRSASPC